MLESTSSRHVLIELEDLRAEDPPPLVRDNRQALERIVEWARGFLWHNHPELGRSGPVCPFARPSMERETFFLAITRGGDVEEEIARSILLEYRDWFFELEPRRGRWAQYKTILVLFPDVRPADAPRVIDRVQEALKEDFVQKGLMLGQFHPRSDEGGLWNPDFRPLRAPVPLLGIRHMVPTDFPFLRDDRELLAVYLERFGQELPPKLEMEIRETAAQFDLSIGPPEPETDSGDQS
ncbi:MAG: hypothetical protein PVG07_07605 [Acidobacteriota bacterium]|jgi:hypothetical protein